MLIRHCIVTLVMASIASTGYAADGLVVAQSPYSAQETSNRLRDAIRQKGLTLFARVDHAAGAATVGKTLRATEVFIFGAPTGGTPFMECEQTVGIDLPLKALVWEDVTARVWLGYNDPAYLARRHGAVDCPAAVNLQDLLASIARQTLKP